MIIGERIKELRNIRNLTQKELSKKANIAEITIRNYEANKYKPKIEQMRKLALALNVSVDSLMGDSVFQYDNTQKTIVGKRIKEKRKEQNITLEQLAKKLGYSLETIRSIEEGTTLISFHEIMEFAKILGTSPAYLNGNDTFLNKMKKIKEDVNNSFIEYIKYLEFSGFKVEINTKDVTVPKIRILSDDNNKLIAEIPKTVFLSRMQAIILTAEKEKEKEIIKCIQLLFSLNIDLISYEKDLQFIDELNKDIKKEPK